jgi:hypothetical protein
MNSREAFKILVMGSDRPTGQWDDESKRLDALLCQPDDLKYLKWLSGDELNRLTEAKYHAQELNPQLFDDYLLFDSVYDLAIYLYRLYDKNISEKRMAFRGQRTHKWKLQPSILRNKKQISANIKSIVKWLENQIALHDALQYYEPIELIAIAQHYEQKTCFLDFSYDYKVAAAFACLDWKSNSEVESIGVIYDLVTADANAMANSFDNYSGKLFYLPLTEVPRIRVQNGLFFSGFNSVVLKNFTDSDRFYFKQSDDSTTYLSDVGFSESDLMPDMKSDFTFPINNRVVKRDLSELLKEVKNTLINWSDKAQKKMTWEDYYEFVLNYNKESHFNEIQLKRIRVFVRWYNKIETLPLSSDAKSIRRIFWAVNRIIDFPMKMGSGYEKPEYNDILGRLNNSGNKSLSSEVFEFLKQSLEEEQLD